MTMIAMDRLPDEAMVWVFGASASLDESNWKSLVDAVDAFLADWTAHGAPIQASRKVIEERFIVIAADPGDDPSGCSIDRLYRTLGELEKLLGVALRDSGMIYFRNGSGHIQAVSRSGFRGLAERGDVTAETVVFDTTVDSLGRFRSGDWELPAGQAWHRSLLPLSATAG